MTSGGRLADERGVVEIRVHRAEWLPQMAMIADGADLDARLERPTAPWRGSHPGWVMAKKRSRGYPPGIAHGD